MARLVPIEFVQVPERRVRREFDEVALGELANNIAAFGLFHALLVQDDGITLVAGERRKRAIERLYKHNMAICYDGDELPIGSVPVVKLTDSDAMQLLECELAENLERQQLTWQEESEGIAALHRLRLEKNPNYNATQMTKDFGNTHYNNRIVESLALAPFLKDKEIAAAPSRKEAVKLLDQKLAVQHRERLAAVFGAVQKDDKFECKKGDLREILPSLDGNMYDCIIADPPYGINAHKMANQAAIQHSYEDTEELSNDLYRAIAVEGWRICREQAHAYLFCDDRRYETVRRIFEDGGWRIWPWRLIWWRGPAVGIAPRPEHGPRRCYEVILFASKGDRKVTGLYPDVLDHPHDRTTERGAHKPASLYADLIRRSCQPGDRVIDPCCGSGTIFDGARISRVRALGIEPEEAAFAQAVERMKG
jgi:site-specific DNA-methyltransferase (adenine-specific)